MVAFNVFTKSLRRTRLNQGVFIPLNHCRKTKRKAVVFVRCFSDSKPNIVKSSSPPVKLPEMPLHEFVFENLHRWESQTALECGISGKKVTYKDLYNTSKILARSLQKKFKMTKGDCQFILLPNCVEYPSIIMAGSMIGVVSTPGNPLYTPHEISLQIGITQPKVIFTGPEFYKNCVDALKRLRIELPIIILKTDPSSSIPPGAVDYSELTTSSTSESLDPVYVDTDSTIILPFSSGTSGLPKGVELTHNNITANLIQVQTDPFFKTVTKNEDGSQVKCLGILPMFHIYGLVVVTLETISSGLQLVTLPKFEPKSFVDTIYTKKINLLYLVPPLVFFLAHQPLVEGKHLQNATSVITGASSFGALDSKAFLKKAPHVILGQGYGMTETSPVVTMTNVSRLHKVDSVGQPVSLTQIKIADIETGKAVPRGTQGEICVKGPQVMKGYLKQPETTKNTFDSEGYLKTGDIGFFDDEGDLFVADRIKELIKVKGFQVAPAEIEETLRSHPKILDAGVIGIVHPTLGEAPKAFIKLKPNVSLTKEETMNFIKTTLAPHKQLKGGVAFVDSIPRNSAGKILRKLLIELHKKSE